MAKFLAVDQIPQKWSTQITMKKLKAIIKGHCEFEKFIKSKHPGCKTIILMFLDTKIREAITRLNAAGYRSHIMKSAVKPKENYKLDTEFPIYQVFMKVHREVMMELLRKYQGLYELDLRYNKRLISQLARVIFDRLTDIIEMDEFTNAYALSVAYRQMHPHLSDYDLVRECLTQVGGKLPRSESELIVLKQKSKYLINRIPADQVMAVCSKYSEKITKTVRDHISTLDAEILPGDTDEEVARKKVRAQLKKLDPHVNFMMKQIINKHFLEKKVRGNSVVIQGEPSLPSWKAMMKILYDFQPFTNVRYLLCNVCAFELSPKQYAPLLAMDGTVYNPDNLSKQDLNQNKIYSLSQLALNIVNAVRQEHELFEAFVIKTMSEEYNALLTELGLVDLVKDQSSATPEVCLSCVYKSALDEVQGTVFSSDCDEMDAGNDLKDYDELLTESGENCESFDENDLVDSSVDDDMVNYDIDLTEEDILLEGENETNNNTSKSLCQNSTNNEKNVLVESANTNPICDHSNANYVTIDLASIDSGTEMVNLESDSDCAEIVIASEINSPDLEVVEEDVRETVAKVSVLNEIQQSIQDIDAEIANIRARHTSTDADDPSNCEATDQFIARLDSQIQNLRERIALKDDSIVLHDTIRNKDGIVKDGNLSDLSTLPDYTDDWLETNPDVIDIFFVENHFAQEITEIVHDKLQTDEGQIGTLGVGINKTGITANNFSSENQTKDLVSANNENISSTANIFQDVCRNPAMEQEDSHANKTLNDKKLEAERKNEDSGEMEIPGPTSDLSKIINYQISTEMQIDKASNGNVQMIVDSAYEMEVQDQCPISEIVANTIENITGVLNYNPVEMDQVSTNNNIISNEMIVDSDIVQPVIANMETDAVVGGTHIEPQITIIQYDEVGKNMNEQVATETDNDHKASDTFTDQDDDCFIVEAPERSIIVISDSDDEENRETRTNTQTIRNGSDGNENRQTNIANSNNGTAVDRNVTVTNNQPRKRKNKGQNGNNLKKPNLGQVVNGPRMSSMNRNHGVTNRFYQQRGPPNNYNRSINNYNRFTQPNIQIRPQQYNNPYPFQINQTLLQENIQLQQLNGVFNSINQSQQFEGVYNSINQLQQNNSINQLQQYNGINQLQQYNGINQLQQYNGINQLQQYNGVYNALNTYMSYHMQTQNRNNAGINASFHQYFRKYESKQNTNNQSKQNTNNQTKPNSNNQTKQNSNNHTKQNTNNQTKQNSNNQTKQNPNNQTNLPQTETNESTKKKKRNRKNKKLPRPMMAVKKEMLNTSSRYVPMTASKQVTVKKET